MQAFLASWWSFRWLTISRILLVANPHSVHRHFGGLGFRPLRFSFLPCCLSDTLDSSSSAFCFAVSIFSFMSPVRKKWNSCNWGHRSTSKVCSHTKRSTVRYGLSKSSESCVKKPQWICVPWQMLPPPLLFVLRGKNTNVWHHPLGLQPRTNLQLSQWVHQQQLRHPDSAAETQTVASRRLLFSHRRFPPVERQAVQPREQWKPQPPPQRY